MNRGELRAAVREELLEPTAARWTDSQLNRYMNDILLDLAKVSRTEIQADPVSVSAGAATFALPATILLPKVVVWVEGGTRYRVRWANAPMPRDTTATGTPYLAWLEGSTVRLWPTPSADGQAIVKGVRRPASLADDADVPELQDVDEALIAGTVWKAYQSDFDPQRDIWAGQYLAAKGAFVEMELRRNPQTGTVRDIYENDNRPYHPWDMLEE